MEGFSNVVQPPFEEVFRKDHQLKGNWNSGFFRNGNPIVLELGCGKGEYTIALARKYPGSNFLGIDIKGARMWKGAATAHNDGIMNAGFLRTRIELINSFFGPDEISEIWITFPDPQLKKRRARKRLTGSIFLNMYSKFLKPGSIIHLKTDSRELFDYTYGLILHNGIEPITSTTDLYSGNLNNEILSVRTFYEDMFISQGKKITYLSFRLSPGTTITEPHEENEE